MEQESEHNHYDGKNLYCVYINGAVQIKYDSIDCDVTYYKEMCHPDDSKEFLLWQVIFHLLCNTINF